MTSTDYKERHGNVAKIIHMEHALKNGLLEKEKALPNFLYIPPPVIKNKEIILYWDKAVFLMVRQNRPDIIVVEKQKKKALFVDIDVPNDRNLHSKVKKKNIVNYALSFLGYGLSKIYQ